MYGNGLVQRQEFDGTTWQDGDPVPRSNRWNLPGAKARPGATCAFEHSRQRPRKADRICSAATRLLSTAGLPIHVAQLWN